MTETPPQKHEAPHVGQMQMDLPGLLKLTSEALYSQPEVAYRELAQNAQDAIVRRRIEEGAGAPAGRLDVRFEEHEGRRFVLFEDNGAGLSADEAREFLATIGRGQTREARATQQGRAEGDALIGQFGVGLLAAFLVADHVDVHSRRFDAQAADGVRWVNEGQQTYELERKAKPTVGTTVRLRIRPDAAHLGTEPAVRGALYRWARYLDVPIHLPSGLLYEGKLPWRRDALPADIRASLDRAFVAEWGESSPLAVVRFEPFEWRGQVIPLEGVAFVPSRAVGAVGAGTASVIIRRMIVARDNRSLLPAWATMVRAVIECAELEPTASREAIRGDELHDAVAQEIDRQLVEALTRMRDERPSDLALLVGSYREPLLASAAAKPALFEAVADAMQVHTTEGSRTLRQCLEQGDGVLRYYRDAGDLETVAVLAAAAGQLVIDARHPAVVDFIGAYVAARQVPAQLFDPRAQAGRGVPVSSAQLARLCEWARLPGVRVELTALHPPMLPALAVEDWDARHDNRVRETLDKPETSDVVRGLLSDLVAHRPIASVASTVLYLNVDNPLIQRLSELGDDVQARAAVRTIATQARLLAERRPTGRETLALYANLTEALETLVGIGGEYE